MTSDNSPSRSLSEAAAAPEPFTAKQSVADLWVALRVAVCWRVESPEHQRLTKAIGGRCVRLVPIGGNC